MIVSCPALRTDGIYFWIYFKNLFTLHFTFLLRSYPNRAVQKLNQGDAHEKSGDDLNSCEKGNCLDPHWAKTEGFRIDFFFEGSRQSQVSLGHRL